VEPAALPQPPDVVFLDVGDTLLRAHPSWAAVYRSVLAEHGVHVEEAPLRAALEAVFGAPDPALEGPFEASAEHSFARSVGFDTQVLGHLGQPPQPDAFYRRLESAFAERHAWWVYDDVAPALRALDAAGIRLCVISNWTWTLPELLHLLELAGHFHGLVTSARVGFEKPHPGIFRHALELMGVSDPGRAVHVGDSIHADIGGARRMGIHPVLMARGGHRHAGAAALPDGTPVVGDLFGLLDRIGVQRPAG